MVRYAHGETVQHIRRTLAAEPDSDGNDHYNDENPVDIQDVGVSPRDGNGTSGNENTQGQETVIMGLTLDLPPGTVVSALDRFRVRGELYEVEGQPEALVNPFTGRNPGLPVSVKRVTG